MSQKYYRSHYAMGAGNGTDELKVHKNHGTDWSTVSMETNGMDNGKITLRSAAMAEQLHFMLGQMLKGGD